MPQFGKRLSLRQGIAILVLYISGIYGLPDIFLHYEFPAAMLQRTITVNYMDYGIYISR